MGGWMDGWIDEALRSHSNVNRGLWVQASQCLRKEEEKIIEDIALCPTHTHIHITVSYNNTYMHIHITLYVCMCALLCEHGYWRRLLESPKLGQQLVMSHGFWELNSNSLQVQALNCWAISGAQFLCFNPRCQMYSLSGRSGLTWGFPFPRNSFNAVIKISTPIKEWMFIDKH